MPIVVAREVLEGEKFGLRHELAHSDGRGDYVSYCVEDSTADMKDLLPVSV
jgi:hypothetical protein